MGIIQRLRNQFNQIVGRPINFPDENEVKWLNEQVRYTPDNGWLEQQDMVLLFCADDTKIGHSHRSLIDDRCFPICTGYTMRKFNYWLMEVGAGKDYQRIPIPMEADGPPSLASFPPSLRVKGELTLVGSELIRGLDTYKQNTVQFRRKRVDIAIPFKVLEYRRNVDENIPIRPLPRSLQGTLHPIKSKEHLQIVRAYMYVAMPEYWDNLLDAGWRGFKTVNHYEPSTTRAWLKEYYDYPKRNLNSG